MDARRVTATFRRVARADHPVSRKNISIGALRVLTRLHDAGFQAFLVGGAVRDLMLGGHPKDFDVATDATPEQVRSLFRNCRLIGRRFRLAHVVFGRETVEVATFRSGADDGSGGRHMVDGRLVRDNVYGTIEEDALRRDFTVNALYYDIADFSVRDYVGGIEDLQQHRLRLIGNPEQRYREDPVRMLRAVRLSAKLGFRIDPATSAPFAALGPLLAEAAPARLFDESLKMFLTGHGQASFRALRECGLLRHVYPGAARALEGARAEACRVLIEGALASTDERIRDGKPVTPAFLFAALLWDAVQLGIDDRTSAGTDSEMAFAAAAERVLAEQRTHVAVPRRFTLVVEEIWALQPVLEQRPRRRVMRLLANPRFRAAYDFLVLRAQAEPALSGCAQWWTEVQSLDREGLARRVAELANGPDQPPAPPRSVRRRRRRRRGGKAAAKTAPE